MKRPRIRAGGFYFSRGFAARSRALRARISRLRRSCARLYKTDMLRRLFIQMCKIFFLYFLFRNGTFAFKNCSGEFKLHYFFLTSDTCDGYYALRTQIRSDGQMLQAVRQSLTWMPETFYVRFPVLVNSL